VAVEQDTGQAVRIADRLYCMQEGRVALEGVPRTLTPERVSQAYFGI
jgi:branched-chain amino acid transport system ATP-binding protein